MKNRKTLSKVIKLKDNRKKELELEVKKALDVLDEAEKRLGQLEGDYENKKMEFNKKNADGGMDVDKLNGYYDLFSYLDRTIEEQKKDCLSKERDLEKIKHKYINAHKDKRALEIINDKAIAKEKREALQSEQKENDFISIARKVR